MTLHDKTNASPAPVLKIGAVVVRVMTQPDSGVHSGGGKQREGGKAPFNHFQLLIICPKPKTEGELPPFVLPRGSRQYQDANGVWHDARDEETGARHADRLEPFVRALEREVAEEAGVTSEMLARARVVELGTMEFASRSKSNYPIHWFLVIPAPADAALLDETLPEDATALEWATLEEIKAMAATGEFSAGYVPVIEVALSRALGAA